MAIYLITGVPGSGKTFLAVKTIAKQYFDYDSDLGIYEHKPIGPRKETRLIVSNIDELRLPHMKLKEIIEYAGCQHQRGVFHLRGAKTPDRRAGAHRLLHR